VPGLLGAFSALLRPPTPSWGVHGEVQQLRLGPELQVPDSEAPPLSGPRSQGSLLPGWGIWQKHPSLSGEGRNRLSSELFPFRVGQTCSVVMRGQLGLWQLNLTKLPTLPYLFLYIFNLFLDFYFLSLPRSCELSTWQSPCLHQTLLALGLCLRGSWQFPTAREVCGEKGVPFPGVPVEVSGLSLIGLCGDHVTRLGTSLWETREMQGCD
jgi:hypothetical protein